MKKYTLQLTLCLLLSGFILYPGITTSQDLDDLWEKYISSETQLQLAEQQESEYLERRTALIQKQQQLRERQSWLNGWIIEMRLAGASKTIVAIADSLEVTQKRLSSLRYRRDSAFNEFKHGYRLMLSQASQSQDTSAVADVQAIMLARVLVNMDIPMNIFPDYTAIFNELYEDEDLKNLVFRDLHRVIERKLALLDTLIRERQMDLALLNRLSEFHQDLATQMETNTEVYDQIEFTETPQRERLSELRYYNDVEDQYYDRFALVGMSNSWDPQEYELYTSENILTESTQYPDEEQISSGSGAGAISEDINQLKQKQTSYRELLEKIRKELTN